MLLDHQESLVLLRKYGIAVPKTMMFPIKSSFADVKSKLSFPCVLKVDAPELLHKSDLHLVAPSINGPGEFQQEFANLKKIMKNQKITKGRFVVQEKIRGVELIMGMSRDPSFGPVMVIGLGGIFVEIFKDVSFRVSPLTKKDVEEMIEELKGKKVLEGFRNQPKVNKKEIIKLMMLLDKLVRKEKRIIALDFNPVMVDQSQAIVVDPKISINEGAKGA